MSKALLIKMLAAVGIVAAVAACDEAPPPTDTVVGRVTFIVDGDTFLIGKRRIRLCGIDAPVQGHPGYRYSAKFLQRMIEGKTVRCVPVGAGATCVGRLMPQTKGRIVAQCFLEGADVADEMVKAGHAKDWRRAAGQGSR
jgi:endonuclease YncB( thermonuclease family)